MEMAIVVIKNYTMDVQVYLVPEDVVEQKVLEQYQKELKRMGRVKKSETFFTEQVLYAQISNGIERVEIRATKVNTGDE